MPLYRPVMDCRMNQACRDLVPGLGVARVYERSLTPTLRLTFRDAPLQPP